VPNYTAAFLWERLSRIINHLLLLRQRNHCRVGE
jgi:hypothetical protein